MIAASVTFNPYKSLGSFFLPELGVLQQLQWVLGFRGRSWRRFLIPLFPALGTPRLVRAAGCELFDLGGTVAQVAGGSTARESGLGLRGSPPMQMATLARSGEYWTVGYEGTTFSLKDVKGLSYIQRLLQHPGEEFHALDLLSGPGAVVGGEATFADNTPLPFGVSIRRQGDAGEMLDARAKQDYRRQLVELREELDDLRERGN